MKANKDTGSATRRATAMTAAEFQALCKRIVAANNRRKRLLIGWTGTLPVGEISAKIGRTEQEPIFELSAKIEIENRTSVLGGVFD